MDDETGYWRVKAVCYGERIFVAANRAAMTARLCGVLNGRKDQCSISTYVVASFFAQFWTGNGFLQAMTCFLRTASGLRWLFSGKGGNHGRVLPDCELACAALIDKGFILLEVWARGFLSRIASDKFRPKVFPPRTQLQE